MTSVQTNNAMSSLGAAGGNPLTGATSQAAMGKEDFLKLLTAQLTHQDPLQPMENTEFVAQLAQFSSLEQMMNVNDNIALLQVGQASMTNSQLAGLIGKEIEAKGDGVQLGITGAASTAFDLDGAAKDVKVKIYDSAGNLVRTLEPGVRQAGVNTVSWDGNDELGNRMTAGRYRVEVSATDAEGNEVKASSRFSGTVTGITYRDGVPMLEVGDATIPVGDVVAVRQVSGTSGAGASSGQSSAAGSTAGSPTATTGSAASVPTGLDLQRTAERAQQELLKHAR